jgi:hypothetical protein
MNLQDSKASDAKTLQSQNSQNTKIRILLSALRVIHGRLKSPHGRTTENEPRLADMATVHERCE